VDHARADGARAARDAGGEQVGGRLSVAEWTLAKTPLPSDIGRGVLVE
jgi:hypothetical protein